MKRLFVILAVAAILAGFFSALAVSGSPKVVADDPVVTFPDPGLEAAIRDAIGKPSGDIYQSDLDGLTVLNAYSRNIVDLTGLEYCINLNNLSIYGNQINDIGLLLGLTNLSNLDLSSNQISDITALFGLTNLKSLQLSYNGISDLYPLSGLTQLEDLGLSWGYSIYDISPLAGLTSLNRLLLEGEQVSDLTPISGLTQLTDLRLYSNQISDVSPLGCLTNLSMLSLGFNQISDLSPLANLSNMTNIGLDNNYISDISAVSGLTKLEILSLHNNQITDISPLAGLANLSNLRLNSNQITDISDLSGLTKLTQLYISDNQVDNISALSVLTKLTSLEIGQNQITDTLPVSNLSNLTSLALNNNYINDISSLSGLSCLKTLDIYANQISDISALSTLYNLTSLDIRDNFVNNISFLSGLTNLNTIRLRVNQVSDILALVNNSGIVSGDYVDLYENPLSAISLHTYIPILQSRGVTVDYTVLTEVWVDDDFSEGNCGGYTFGYDAFNEIQDGIDMVSGSTVHVAEGTYRENIVLKDGVELLGSGNATTIIDGMQNGSVVTAINLGNITRIDSFTITNGSAALRGGGIYNQDAYLIISDCIFESNTAPYGAGMCNYNASPAISNCTFSNNSATSGGGMYNRQTVLATISGCFFYNNSASQRGGAIENYDGYCTPAITGCIFQSNHAITDGGGMHNGQNSAPTINACIFKSNTANLGGAVYSYTSSATMTNCIFNNNSAANGGGIYNSGSMPAPSVINCDFWNNSAASGGGMYNYASTPGIYNCIVWNNSPDGIYNDSCLPTASHSDIQGELYTGEDNINADPSFVDATGADFHLNVDSPCINTGTNLAPSLPSEDYEDDPRICPGWGAVDMGADEYTDTIPPELNSIVWIDINMNSMIDAGDQLAFNWSEGMDTSGVTVENVNTNLESTASGTGNDYGNTGLNVSWNSPANMQTTITLGVGEMISGGEWVNPNDSVTDVVGNPDSSLGAGAQIPHPPAPSQVWVDAVFNASTSGWEYDHFARIQDGINDVSTPGTVHVASGTYYESITLRDGVVLLGSGSTTTIIDGMRSGSVITANNVGNTTILDGFTVTNGTGTGIFGQLSLAGGGMYNYYSSPTITNCIFSANSVSTGFATRGGGIYNYVSSPTITNCIFQHNVASTGNGYGYGGSIYNYNSLPTITNCVFWDNSANDGGGIYNDGLSPTITNCILWDDAPNEVTGTANVTYSDVQGGYTGDGNINSDPLFIDASAGDFHLGVYSPCIDAGNNSASSVPVADYEGDSRLIDANADGIATVDMGADEYTDAVPPVLNTILWADINRNSIVDSGDRLEFRWNDKMNTSTVTALNVNTCLDSTAAGVLDYGDAGIQVTWNSPYNSWATITLGVNEMIQGGEWVNPDYTVTDVVGNADATPGSGAQILPVPSETWVDDDFNASTSGWEYDHFARIQYGIDNVSTPGVIHVAAGVYYENIVLKDGVELLGAGNASTIIDGSNAGSVVTATNCGNTTWIDGFTITNGSGTTIIISGTPHQYGGGMYNTNASIIITHCTFQNNTAELRGGGIYNRLGSAPNITDCIFRDNMTSHQFFATGGGVYNDASSPTIMNCIFQNNSAGTGQGFCSGGGIYNAGSSATITNSVFRDNSADEGGGICNAGSSPTITNSVFWSNSADEGGGIHNAGSSPTITNCILWDDAPDEITNYGTCAPVITYCDVQGGYSGVGNINSDPLFKNALAGDFHLKAGSPCIDAGNNSAVAIPVFDFEGDLRIWPEGGTVDMGADERIYLSPPVFEVWVDDDYINGSCGGHTWGYDAFNQIQYGADNVSVPGTVHVASGTYYENVMLRSGIQMLGEGNASTIIDGGGNGSAVIAIYVDATARIDGFTMTNGRGTVDPVDQRLAGGGMYNYHSSPVVSNCVFEGNTPVDGGGMFNMYSSPNISNCYFRNNVALEDGGGICNLEGSSPAITSCIFESNIANKDGGGIFNAPASSSPTIVNCVFWNNSATGLAWTTNDGKGGGIYNYGASPIITNCDFIGNSAVDGGAIRGYEYAAPVITNCIIWGNSAPQLSGYVGQVVCSDVQGSYPGGNIDSDPLFANASVGDFHLTSGSPCIDAGYNSAFAIPSTDYEGDDRMFNNVDMGVDEYVPAPTGVYGDANGDGEISLPDYAAVRNMLLGRRPFNPGADANQDGDLSLSDYAAVRNMLLGRRLPAAQYQSSYNFSSGSGVDRWAMSNSMSAIPPALSETFATEPDGWVGALAGDYTNIALTDGDVWTIAGTFGNYSALQCKFTVDINPEAIVSIGVTLNGSAESNGDVLQIWAWNFNTSSWRQIGGNCSMTTGIASYSAWTAWGEVYSDYVDEDGYMYILANLNNADQGLNVDYIELKVAW